MFLLGKNYRVDYVDHTVLADDIGLHDVCLVDHDLSTVHLDRDLGTLNRFGILQLHNIGGHDVARNDVVRENSNEFFLVLWLEQRLESAFRQLFESGVRWCEHCEWAFALQRLDQACGFYRCDQRVEVVRSDGGVNNVLIFSNAGMNGQSTRNHFRRHSSLKTVAGNRCLGSAQIPKRLMFAVKLRLARSCWSQDPHSKETIADLADCSQTKLEQRASRCSSQAQPSSRQKRCRCVSPTRRHGAN